MSAEPDKADEHAVNCRVLLAAGWKKSIEEVGSWCHKRLVYYWPMADAMRLTKEDSGLLRP